jgi:hypothetical protein
MMPPPWAAQGQDGVMSGSVTVLDNTNGGTVTPTGSTITGGSLMRAVVFLTDNTSTWEIRGLRLNLYSGVGDANYTINIGVYATAYDGAVSTYRPIGIALGSVSLSLYFTSTFTYQVLNAATLGAVATTTLSGGTRYALVLSGPTTGPRVGTVVTAPTASNGYSFVRSATTSNSGSSWSTSGSTPLMTLDVQATCFLRGTLILTARGEVKVEALREGDLVATRFGGLRPIRWIGTQRFDGRFAGRATAPIRFARGSLGAGLPSCDLFVSPGHAMLAGDVLAHAGALVNGSTITQEKVGGVIEYFHLDLGPHDCVLANGAWAESYFEDRNRDAFHNAPEFHARFPGHTPVRQETCLPIMTAAHPAMEGLRAMLAPAAMRAAA